LAEVESKKPRRVEAAIGGATLAVTLSAVVIAFLSLFLRGHTPADLGARAAARSDDVEHTVGAIKRSLPTRPAEPSPPTLQPPGALEPSASRGGLEQSGAAGGSQSALEPAAPPPSSNVPASAPSPGQAPARIAHIEPPPTPVAAQTEDERDRPTDTGAIERQATAQDGASTGTPVTNAMTPPPRPAMLEAMPGLGAKPKASTKREMRATTRKQEGEAGRRTGPQRTAAVAPPLPETAAPTATATPAPPQDDRMRVLGLPLPTGREIKDCLFSFRC
jgi:hypothetical protein